ncbi:NADPH-dependent FMN reductase [Catellatospora coxensis]
MLIQVINGTTREGRFSERIAHWVLEFGRQYEGVEFELVDLRDHPLPFFDGAAPCGPRGSTPTRRWHGSAGRWTAPTASSS